MNEFDIHGCFELFQKWIIVGFDCLKGEMKVNYMLFHFVLDELKNNILTE